MAIYCMFVIKISSLVLLNSTAPLLVFSSIASQHYLCLSILVALRYIHSGLSGVRVQHNVV